MAFTKGNSLSTGRPKGSKNNTTREVKSLLNELLFNKEQLLEDWNGMDLRERSEFRIRMAKYVIPEIKEGFSSQGDSNSNELMLEANDLEIAILKDIEDARKIQ